MGKSTIDTPHCAACHLAKAHRQPTHGSTSRRSSDAGILSNDKLEPGDLIFVDQYESRTEGKMFGVKGRAMTSSSYRGGTLFYDAASGKVAIVNQASLSGSETVSGKMRFEREAA